MLIFGERHLRAVLTDYPAHYNGRRPHRSRDLQPPRPDHPVADLTQERIRRHGVLGGLITSTSAPHNAAGQELWPSIGTPQDFVIVGSPPAWSPQQEQHRGR